MEVERGVTEWGMPILQWYDSIGTMTGNPLTDNLPKVETRWATRRLWIAHNGIQVCALDDSKEAVVGNWDEWKSVELGSTRDDLSPQDVINLERWRLRFVEHQTLTAYFTDGTINRIAQSAVAPAAMRDLHEAITRTFILERPRGQFVPPRTGRALRGREIVWPRNDKLWPGEQNKSQWKSKSPIDRLKAESEQNVPSIDWFEPIKSRGGFFGGVNHHFVQRLLYVAKGDGPERRWLSYATYQIDGNALRVHMPFDHLEDFVVKEFLTEEYNPALQVYYPVPDALRASKIIVAKFRYGYMIPLTFTDDERIEGLCRVLKTLFLPLVGKRISDADLGLAPVDSAAPIENSSQRSFKSGIPSKL
jgi:hypothetical protein